MRKYIIILFILLSATTAALAQELRIVALNESLDKVLTKIGVEVSFDSKALSQYKITVNQFFSTPQQAIDFILSGKPFICQKISEVYVISAKPTETIAKKKKSIHSPYVATTSNELPAVKIVQISEVVITAPSIQYSPTSGDISAESIISHQVAHYIPGSTDNSVFNLLRMMPGVRASGEPSEEFIVWGSSAGESRILFDGIPLFGMHGFNDNISFINPYLVREIRLMKGGYGVNYGNQIGAIAEVKGYETNTERPSVKATISTLTANLYTSIPLTERSALSVAYRRTFYDLYENDVLNPYNGNRPATANQGKGKGAQTSNKELYIIPKYSFTDLNIIYSGHAFAKDTYRVTYYGANDRFSYHAEPAPGDTISGRINSRQLGASALYNRVWSDNNQSQLSFSFSRLNTTNEMTNLAQQFSAKFTHTLTLKNDLFEVGTEFDKFQTDEQTLLKHTLYITNQLTVGKLSLRSGVRADFLSKQINIQPRLSSSYQLTKHLTATASWGIYNEYLSQIPVDKQTIIWGLNEQLSAMHTIAGIAYRSPFGFSASLEGYIKRTKNAIRIVDNKIKTTDVKIRGGDLFLKYDYTKGTIFGSYSLYNTTDIETGQEVKLGTLINLKPFFFSANYVYGSGFATLDLSGKQGQKQGIGNVQNTIDTNTPYNRFDVAVTYRLQLKKVQLQAGISLINLFDSHNIKYSYTTQSKKDPITLYSEAMPFTPMLFFGLFW